MSESPTSPIPQRDMRSAAKPFKRDRDSGEKWSMGTRPLAGARINYSGIPGSEDSEVVGGDQTLKEKVRPCKPCTHTSSKFNGNTTPKPSNHYYDCKSNTASLRLARKVDALIDANDHNSSLLSESLIEILPQHANNTAKSIQTVAQDHESGILYSYEGAGASPGAKGRAVGLDSLVEMAEKKWVMEQTEKMVKGEYEVLDDEGAITFLTRKKKKDSPKQKAAKNAAKDVLVQEDDGFELI